MNARHWKLAKHCAVLTVLVAWPSLGADRPTLEEEIETVRRQFARSNPNLPDATRAYLAEMASWGAYFSRFIADSDVAKLKEILDAQPSRLVNASARDGRPLLAHAAWVGSVDSVKFLLSRGANVRQHSPGSGGTILAGCSTPLHLAAHGGHVEVVKLLLAAGAKGDDPNGPARPQGPPVNPRLPVWTPLHLAASEGRASVVKLLLESQVSADPKIGPGHTPLQLAIQPPGFEQINYISRRTNAPAPTLADYQATARILLGAGASPFVTNRFGTSAMDVALVNPHDVWLDLLLTNARPATLRDARGQTLGHLAVTHGRINLLPVLAANGADLQATNAAGHTLLQHLVVTKRRSPAEAARDEMMEPGGYYNLLAAGLKPDGFTLAGIGETSGLAQLLTDRPELLSEADRQGWSLLHWAADSGQLVSVKFLISSSAPLAARDRVGRTALHNAADRGYDEIARRLIQAGAALALKDTAGESPLALAAAKGHEAVLKILLEREAPLEDAADGVTTPLHRATTAGQLRSVEILLKAGARGGATDEKARTPLHLAVGNRHAPMVDLLLKHNAPPRARDADGRTPLDVAAGFNDDASLVLLAPDKSSLPKDSMELGSLLQVAVTNQNQRFAAQLLDAGAPAVATNRVGHTPLMVAAAGGSRELSMLLLKHGASLLARDTNGNTPLHLAAGNGDTTRLLVQAGASINATNSSGQSPLFLAALRGDLFKMEALLAFGADLHARGTNGDTILHATLRRPWSNPAPDQLGNEAFLLFRARVGQLVQIRGPRLVPSPATPAFFGGRGLLLDRPRFQWIGRESLPPPQAEFSLFESVLFEGLDRLADFMWIGRGPSHAPNHLGRWAGDEWKYLLASGAHVYLTNGLGQTPLHALAASTSPRFGTHPSRVEVAFEYLKRQGADFEARDLAGRTPLHLAAATPDPQRVAALLRHGAGVNARDRAGRSPLHLVLEGRTNPFPGVGDSSIALMKAGADVNLGDSSGRTVVHLLTNMISGGDWNPGMAQLIVEGFVVTGFGPPRPAQGIPGVTTNYFNTNAVHVNARDHNGDTPLHFAARAVSIGLVNYLVSKGGDMVMTNRAGETPFQIARSVGLPVLVPGAKSDLETAVRSNDTATVQAFLKWAPEMVTDKNRFGMSPLQLAAREARQPILELFAAAGLKLDAWSATHLGRVDLLAAALKEDPEQVRAPQVGGGTLMHVAAMTGRREVAELLVAKGADVNATNIYGLTPLFFASRSNHTALAQSLRNLGARETIFDAVMGEDAPLVRSLLASQAGSGTTTNRAGETPLHRAVASGNLEIVELLLAAKADPNAMSRFQSTTTSQSNRGPVQTNVVERGVTPLHIAAGTGRPDLLQMLLKAGARPSVFDFEGHTPLSYAASIGHEPTVRLLIEAGSAINVRPPALLAEAGARVSYFSPAGDSALHLAAQAGFTNVAKLLLAHGADVNATNRFGQAPLDLARNPRPGPRIIPGTVPYFRPETFRISPLWARPADQAAIIELLLRHGGREAGGSPFGPGAGFRNPAAPPLVIPVPRHAPTSSPPKEK